MVTKEENRNALIAQIREKREQKKQQKLRAGKRRRIASVAVIIAVMVAMAGVVYNVSAKEITITEINEFTGLNETQRVRTRGGNVGDVLEENGLSVGEDDKINVSTDAPISDTSDIIITRGKRVTIKVGDQEQTALVTKADATDALVEAGFAPGAYDSITSDGDTIELIEISHTEEETTETIQRGVSYVDDPDLPKGKEVVVDEGEDGIKEIQHKVTYENGAEKERFMISENIAAEPRDKVIARGTAEATPEPKTQGISDNGGTINGYSYKKKFTMTATAYSTDPSENAGYTVSAMGNPLGYGIVAVDPNVIPLGSTVYVTAPDGSWVYGVASAEDTGGAIKGNKIDLCFPYNNDAFGRRSCVVYVLD